MSKIAMCHTCDEPLVGTFYFHKKEFICLNCGRLYEFFGPSSADETPELIARMEELAKEWEEDFAPYLLTPGMYHKECKLCNGREAHINHATEEEIVANKEARTRLKERTSQ